MQVMEISKKIKLKVGKSYKINVSQLFNSNKPIHIDYILQNKKYKHWSETLIVYRYFTEKYGWVNKIEPYYTLAILNDWDWGKEDKIIID